MSDSLKASPVPGCTYHLGLDMRAPRCFDAELRSYAFDGNPASAKAGSDVVTSLGGLYIAADLISVEDPFDASDHQSFRALSNVLHCTCASFFL